jgi:hypothetical protein
MGSLLGVMVAYLIFKLFSFAPEWKGDLK